MPPPLQRRRPCSSVRVRRQLGRRSERMADQYLVLLLCSIGDRRLCASAAYNAVCPSLFRKPRLLRKCTQVFDRFTSHVSQKFKGHRHRGNLARVLEESAALLNPFLSSEDRRRRLLLRHLYSRNNADHLFSEVAAGLVLMFLASPLMSVLTLGSVAGLVPL